MKPVYAIANIAEFTKDPAAVLRQASNGSVIVVNHTHPLLYVVPPHVFEALMSGLPSAGLHEETRVAQAEIAEAAPLEARGDHISPQLCPACGGSGWVLNSGRTGS